MPLNSSGLLGKSFARIRLLLHRARIRYNAGRREAYPKSHR